MVLFAGIGCSREEVTMAEMPFSLCLPANEVYVPNRAPRRVVGDPGTTEQFALPTHAYIILLRDLGAGWEVYRCIEETLTEDDWTFETYNGIYETQGNPIYRCTKRLEILLDDKGIEQRVYAVASSVPLTFSKSFSTSSISTLDDVLGLKINMSAKATRAAVANIYSTPYNYSRPGTSSYYCSFISPKVASHASMDLLLYHIASKVDINWFVEKNKRINKDDPDAAVRLTTMKACNLYSQEIFCFKPLENVAPSVVTAGDTVELVRPSDEGLWWEGRSYFYTIPYTTEESGKQNYFPLQMLMETNESGNEYKPTIYMQIDKTSPFTPWLRANFNLSAPLSAETPTKTVNY